MNSKQLDNNDRPYKGRPRPSLSLALIIYAGCAVIAIAVTLYVGSRHDYTSYLLQWQLSLSGGDQWAIQYDGKNINRNAYGPLHVLFAKLLIFGDLAPKLVFSVITLIGPALVLMSTPIKEQKGHLRQLTFAVFLYAGTPIVGITVYLFGINDGIVGFFLIIACILRSRGWYGLVGFIIGLAALLKFYPLLFAPFFAIGRARTVQIRTIAAAAVTFGLGMYSAYLYWGPSVFSPILFGSSRGPKHLSILRFLDQVKDELSITPLVEIFISTNSYFVVVVAALVALWGWKTRESWEVTVLLGVLFVFLSYKVGHQQFYVSWISVHWWILVASRNERAVFFARSFIPVAIFLSLYQLLYLISWMFTGSFFDGPGWEQFRTYGSVILLMLVIWSLIRCQSTVKVADRTPTDKILSIR